MAISNAERRYRQTEKGKLSRLKYKRTNKYKQYQRLKYRQSRYRLSIKDFNKLLTQQDSRCKICSKEFDKTDMHDTCIDHDHITNSIRGLLCRKCNVALGMFNDSVINLVNAIKYLEEAKEKG